MILEEVALIEAVICPQLNANCSHTPHPQQDGKKINGQAHGSREE